MTNFPELRPGERSAEAERVAVLRSASPVRLAAVAMFVAAIFMAVMLLGAPGRSEGPPAFLSKALGAADSEAPLVRHPEAGVELAIQDSSFRIRSSSATVTLATQGAGPGDWHRFEHGVSRPIAEGAETILVDGPTLEQFLTIRERQGLRTWRWRIDTAQVPRVGYDGAVAFLDTKLHRLTDVSIAPAAILDAEGKDVTPNGLRWSVELRNDAWWLTLRLDDSKLPLPYVIDPAVTHRNTQTGTATGATSVSVTKPTGVQANDLLVAHVMVTGNVTASIAGSGWTAVTSGTAANAATQASFYKIAGGSEPASYSFTWTGSQAAAATVTAYYGVKSSSPFDLFSTIASTNNTTSVTAATLTTTANDDIVLAFFGSASNSTYTPPGSWNERGDVGTTGISASTADQIKVTAGATGNAVATSTVSARVWGHQAAFKVDNVAPTATMSDPGSPVTGTISLQTSATNDADSYVAQVQFERSPAGAGSWTNVGSADTTSPYSVSFDTTTVTDGLYDFRAVATDGAGNTGNSATISNRRIDNTAPSSTTSFPASGGSYNTAGWNAGCGTNGFCGTYSDSGSGVQKVEISIGRNTGNYWSAGSFSSGSEVWNTTTLAGGNWSYTFPASSFPANDTYTIRVRATDNVSIAETPNSRSFTYDTAAPDTSITANPADPTTSTSASFSFTSTEGSSTFECQIDGGGYSSCTSPKSYAGPLSDGSHTFLVRATDPAGNTDASAASYTWSVDTAAPSSTVSFPSSGASYNASGWNAGCATNGFCGTHTDATSGVQKVEISIRQGAGNYWSAGSFSSGSEVWNTTTLAGGNWSYTFPASSFPADGTYTIRVRATDNVNLVESPSSRSFTIDRVAPDTTIDSNPSNPSTSANASFSFSSTEGSSTFECQIDGGGYSSCTSPKSYSSLSEGSHTFLVRATDAAGNTDGSAASYTWTVDTVAPSSTTSFPASAGTYNTSGWNAGCGTIGFCGTYSDATTGVQKVEISIRQGAGNYWNGSSFGSGSEVFQTASLAAGNWSYAFPASSFPADGSYTIRVKATDNATNAETPASRSFTYDATNPSALFTFPASGAAYKNAGWNAGCGTNGFCGTYSDATAGVQSVEISIRQGAGNYWNGTSFGSGSEVFQTASLAAGNWSYAFPASSFPADGSYTVHIRAKDNALNTETGPSRSFTIDNVDPSALFSFPASGGSYNTSGWNAGCGTNGFCGTYSDATSGVQSVEISIRQGAGNYWNGTSFGSGSEIFQTASLAAGNWSYAFPASSFPADGSYTVHIRAKDYANNTETGPSRSFTFDTTAPNTTIDSNPTNPSSSANANFTFPSTEGGSTFECEIDGGGFSSCTTPKSYAGLSEGNHTFEVRATDAAGNTDASPAQYTWTVDTVAPNTTTDSNPTNPSSSANANFTFSSTEGGSTFECEIDGGGFSSCTTPKSYAGLSEGNHTFEVRATDAAGNTDASPAQYTWTVDTVAPSSTTSFPGSGAAYNASGWNAGCGTIGLCGTYSDVTSGVQKVEISIRQGTGNYWNGTSFGSASEVWNTTSLSGGSWSFALATTDFPADGNYTVRVRATDNAGNVESASSRSFGYDTAAPASTTSFPGSGASYNTSGWNAGCGTAGFCGTYSDATSGVQAVEISIRQGAGNYWNGTSFGSGAEVWNLTTTAAGNWEYALAASSFPADGSYTIRVKATDNAGNGGSPSSRSFTIDTAAPNTTIDSSPNLVSNSAAATFTFSSTEGSSTFECEIDGGGFSSCSAPKSYSSLSEGSHTFKVRATDQAGNTDASAAQFTWTVDTVDPSAAFTFPAASGNYELNTWNIACATAGFCGTYSDATSGVQSVEISIRQGTGDYWNGTSFGSASEDFHYATIGGGDWSYAFPASSFPAGGNYTVHVRATDNATNTETGPSRTFTYDTTPPETTIDSTPSDPSTSSGATFTFSADEGGSTFQCELDGAGVSSCSTPKSYSGLSEGNHTFEVRATDAAGNTDPTPAQYTWTVDTTSPSSSTTFPASGAAYNAAAWNAGCGTVGFCGTYSDATTGVQKVEISIRRGAGNYWNGSGFSSGSEVWNLAGLSGGNWSYAFATNDFPADGSYTIRVKASDNAGNGETPASRSFTYDTADPSALFSFSASGGDYTDAAWNAGCGTAGFCGTYSDATSGVQAVEISIRRGTGNYWNGTSFGSASEAFQTTSLSAGNWSYAFSAASFPVDGSYTVHVRATDNAWNTESGPSRTFRIDNADPSALFSFPGSGGAYSNSGWNAGCGTNGFCGTYSDATSGVQAVDISIQRVGTGLYWNGSAFSSGSEDFQAASFSGGNWSYAFPAPGFPADGSYTVHIRAHDNAGNTETGPSRSFTIDNVAPSTTVDSGPSDPSASADATFAFSATEGGSTFECELDGGGFSACSSPKSYTSLSEGSHTFEVLAVDVAGNTDATPAQSTWSIDTVAPNSTMTFPASGASYRTSTWNTGCATAGLCGTYADATSGVQAVEISIRRGTGNYWNGTSFGSASEVFQTVSLSAGNWSYAFGAAGFPADDDYTVRVRATDNAGNAEPASSRTFTFDATAPTGSLTAPAHGAVISGSSVTVSSDSADAGSSVALATFERRPSGGGSWTTIDSDSSAPYAVSWDTTAVGNGDYDLRVTTDDESGNSFTSATRTVTVDNTAPSSATLDALPGAIRNGQGLTGSGADADSGVASLSYYYCAGPPCSPSTLIGASATGPSYSVTWSSQPADGDYQVLVRVANGAGSTLDSTKQTVTVDNADPTGSLTAPADGAQVSGSVAVSSDSADSGSGVDSALFERRPAGGGAWTAIGTDTSAPYSVSWDTTPLGDGDYDLHVVTTDAAGNSFTSATRTVSVDNHAPTVSMTVPGAYVNGAAADPFTVTATSPDTDIASVEFFVCSNQSSACSSGSWSSLGAPDATAPYTASWDVQGDGNQALRAVITDNASNTGSDVVNTLVDRTDPSGSVTSPAGGAFLSGTVSVSADSADPGSGVDSALFERRPSGGGAWTAIGTDTSAPYSVSWDTSALNGDFDLHVVTTDSAGNAHTSAAATVAVDNTVPSAPAIALSESSPYADVSGQTVFVNTGQSGSYDVDATSSDAQSGIEKIRFPGPVDDTSSPYGTSYGFGALSGSQTVTAFNGAGLTASDTFTVTPDTTAPATSDDTGTIGSAWRNAPVTVALSPSDGGAGVATTYYTTDGSTPTTSSSQGTSVDLTSIGVYTIKYFSVDRVGNAEAVKTAGTQIRVDLTDPSAPALTLSESSAFAHVAGTTIYVKSGQTGMYTVAATSNDPLSGIDKIRFPGGVDDSVSPFQTIYALDDLTGTQTVTAFDSAGNTSSSTFDVTADDAAPSGGSVTYTDGYDADGQILVSTSNGTDALSGVDGSTGVLERRTSALTDGTCAVFSGSWSPVSSPDTVGTDTCAQYRDRVSDHVSNEVVYTSANVVKVDQTAPNTSIGSTPNDPTNATGATFTFSATETGSTFECELDGGGFSSCASPKSYAGLAEGSHTFKVRATDVAGNTDASPAQFTWAVDTTPPNTSIGSTPNDPTNATGATFTFSSTQGGSTFQCELDGGGFTSCSSPKSYSGLADGSHTFNVRATDQAGNTDGSPAQFTWTVDTAAPDTTIDVVPPDPDTNPSPSVEFSATEGGSTFECELDGGGFTSCSSPTSYSGLADGSHTFNVRATDQAGNTDSTPASYTWAVNAGAPSVSITAPIGFVNLADADPFTVTATSPDGDVSGVELFTCTDASSDCSTGSWVSLGTDATAPFTASWSLPADGNGALRAVATDVGSNTGEDIVNVTVDRTRPDTSIDSAPADPTSTTGASFDFSASEAGVSFQCRLDGGSFGACSSPKSYSSLAEGAHTFDVQATDAAGNAEAAPQTYTWTVDTTAPDTSITASPADPSSASSADFSFTSTEGGSSFECRLDGGSFASCTSPASYTGLADGSHTFRVRATDTAGNTDASAAVYTWTVDATAPGGGLADPGSPLRGTVNISASPSDTGVGVQQVVFQSSPADAGTWSPIATDTTSPYTASWDTTGVADDLYDLRIVVTDNVGNTFASTVVEDRLVDNTDPTAVMNDPGSYLKGTVNLTSTTGDAGSGVATVTYQRSPAGAGTWTNVSATWNTTSVADGLYDLRVRVTDNAGNVTISASVDDRRVDNTAPTLSSSNPSDGSKVPVAGSLAVTANENLADVFASAIDGGPVAGVASSSTVTFTQAFAAGPHTLSGELEDLAGNRTPIRVHFTVWNTTGGDYPYIEKNSFASSAMTVALTNGDGQLRIPAGAWSGAPVGDWLVAKVDPRPAGALSAGFAPQGDIYDVSAYWALAGGPVTSFDEPIDLTLTNGAGTVVPAFLNGSAWQPIARLAGTTLPGGTQSGFYKDGDTVHLLTRSSGTFTLLHDLAKPRKPKRFKGKDAAGRLVLSWKASTDNSGLVDAYLVYVKGAVNKTVPGSELSADMGAFSQSDTRSFQVAARDAAGNVSGRTFTLVVIPKVAKLSLAKAKTALSKRGLKPGKISYVFSTSVPKGSVVSAGKSGLVTRSSAVALTVSKGRAGRSTPRDTAPPPTYPPSTTPPPTYPPPTTPPDPPLTDSGQVDPETTPGAGEPEAEPEPESFNATKISSARRTAGLVLLACLFLGAGAMALRARRRLIAPMSTAENVDGPILFWDERLLRGTASAIRRALGPHGR